MSAAVYISSSLFCADKLCIKIKAKQEHCCKGEFSSVAVKALLLISFKASDGGCYILTRKISVFISLIDNPDLAQIRFSAGLLECVVEFVLSYA